MPSYLAFRGIWLGMKVVGPRVYIYVLTHEWDHVGLARNQICRTLVKMGPKTKGISK
jgi:hypothetical protein